MGTISGELTRAVNHEANDDWPTSVEIVAYFGPNRTKRRSVIISADEFFGRGRFGAPLSGDQLIRIINDLRRKK